MTRQVNTKQVAMHTYNVPVLGSGTGIFMQGDHSNQMSEEEESYIQIEKENKTSKWRFFESIICWLLF